MKVKRSFINLLLGLLSQFILLALGIVIPRLFLINFGSEVNGLLASIGQVMVYMTLFEAGVGAASIQALYKPIALEDKQKINSILAATEKYYRKTGLIYFFTVFIISLIYPHVIKSSLDILTITVVFLLIGMSGALNYFFIGEIKIFLLAQGKNYVETTIVTVMSILNNIIKIFLLMEGYNIISIQVAFLLITILQIFLFKMYIKKHYKWLDLKEKPDFHSINQKNSVMVHQFSTLVFSNTDVIILTIFTNLKVVSVYVMYNMLFSIIENVINVFKSSITAALGQTYHESKELFLKFYDAFETYYLSLVFSFLTIAFILIMPFMKLYTSGITDINYIDKSLPIMFVSIKLLSNARVPSDTAVTIAGHFKNTKYRSLAETAINLVCSLIFVQFYGIYGVLMGTIAALFYRTTDILLYASKYVLYRSPWIALKRLLINLVLITTIILCFKFININPTSYLGIIIWALILVIIIGPIYFIICSFIEKEVYRYSKNYYKLLIGRMKKSDNS